MKSALTLLFLFIISLSAVAQASDCNYYIHQGQTRKKVRSSLYPLNFSVKDSIEVLININDKGKPGHIEIVFSFEDRSGLPLEMGSILNIKFIDNTTYSIIASSRKEKSSIVYFTLSDASSRKSTINHSNQTDTFLTDKLSKIDIREFEITVDGEDTRIAISETKSVIIRNMIVCLFDTNSDK